MMLKWAVAFLAMSVSSSAAVAQHTVQQQGIWSSRDTAITLDGSTSFVRIGVWDSGVDTTLFATRLARTAAGLPLLRGYDSFKRRQDTFLAVLDTAVLAKRDELNAVLQAFDDLDSNVESPMASALAERLDKMTKDEEAAFGAEIGVWSGYAHGTAVADIATAGNDRPEIVVARMEWWHGSWQADGAA